MSYVNARYYGFVGKLIFLNVVTFKIFINVSNLD